MAAEAKRKRASIRAVLEARDPGLVSFAQAIETVTALGITFVLIRPSAVDVRLLALLCTAFVMQCRSGRSRAQRQWVMILCGLILMGLVWWGSVLESHPLFQQAALPIVACFCFVLRRFLPEPATYTVFLFIAYLLAAAFPGGQGEVAARLLTVGLGVVVSLGVVSFSVLGGGREAAFWRVAERYHRRSREFRDTLGTGQDVASGRASGEVELDRRYDRLLVLLSYSQNLVGQVPAQRRAHLEPILLAQFDTLHSLYMLRTLRERMRLTTSSPALAARRLHRFQFHAAGWRRLDEILEKARCE